MVGASVRKYGNSIKSCKPAAIVLIPISEDKDGAMFKALGLLICLLAMLAASAKTAAAQAFQPVAAIKFTMPFGGANPLAQVVSIGTTGAALRFGYTVTSITGGAWLTTPSSCCYSTPSAITVTAAPAAGLAVGTYTAQILVTSSGITPVLNMTIPVSLTIEPATAAFLDAPAGALKFSMGLSGKTPPVQPLTIRNAGSGTLSWTASASTSDGGGWLTLSSTSGTAPSLLNVGINPAKLPSADLVAGTFTGQVLLQSGSDSVTVPVTIAVGPSILRQIQPLSFTKAFGGANPVSQFISLATADASIVRFSGTAINGTGGSWLSISASGCCYNTPYGIVVTVNPVVTLAAGTYTSEIVLTSATGSDMIVVPVSLTVAPPTVAFFDASDGALTFSMKTSGIAPAVQTIPIRSAGTGTVAWTAAASTADGNNWLTLSAASGTAPSTLTVAVNPANIPGGGLTAGTVVGEVLLTTAGDTFTVPVTFLVGPSVLRQLEPLSFTKAFGGGNPSSQLISLTTVDGSVARFSGTTINSTGGTWLSISESGCCYNSPQAIAVSVNPEITLAAGTYEAEIVLETADGTDTIVVPVSLTVAPPTAAFFDTTSGALTFSMEPGGLAPPVQAVPIRNAGMGVLAWTASVGTADGGNWLTLSAVSGAAPSNLNVGVNPANLPGGGLTAGTYVGQVLLTTAGDTITVPVTLVVGTSAFQQIDSLTFTKTYAGGNPPEQVIDLSSNGTSVRFSVTVVNSTGGDWLTATINGCCYYTPYSIGLSVNPATTLAAGTYTAEVLLTAADNTQSMVVPVTLIIKPSSAAYFDALPGGLTFSMVTSGIAPPAQLVQIRNAGTGVLSFTATASTSDSGKWITLSWGGGNAPYLLNVGVNPAALPGGGVIPGNYTGQVVLQTSGDTVTIPVSFSVGSNVFGQINPLSFSKVYGGANPLPQVITISNPGASIRFAAATVSSTGGTWLSIPINGCCYYSPQSIAVTVNPAVTLAAGSYFAEVVLTTADGTESVVVPVTLNIEPAAVSSFDTLPGAVTFAMLPGGATPAAQTVPIRDAGPGILNWSATTITSDGGRWLNFALASGPAPYTDSISIVPANLPGKGVVPGLYTGMVTLQSLNGIVTIPVTVTVGASVDVQLAAQSFTKSYQGTNPSPTSVILAGTSASLRYNLLTANSTGGSWLSIAQNGCCYYTPTTLLLTANPNINLAPGVYTSEIVATSPDGSAPSLIPVSLTVTSPTATATPTFTPAGGTYTSSQTVTIASATTDAAIYYTTNNTTPTTSSTRYIAPIQVTASQTIKAIAIAPAYSQSLVGSATYTINAPQAATPAAVVTITEATTGVTVYYTTNGTIPTSASAVYTGPITLAAGSVLKFIAIGPNYTASMVRTITTTVP